MPGINTNKVHLKMATERKNKYEVHLIRRASTVEFGDVTYQNGGTHGPRIQSAYQIVVLVSGSLTLTIDSRVVVVPPHHAVLLCPGHQEFFVFSRDTESRHLWVTMHPNSESFSEGWADRCPPGPIPASARLNALMQLGLERGNASWAAPVEVLRCLGQACFFELVSDSETIRNKRDAPSPAVEKALTFIGDRLAQIASLNEIATAAAVSAQHLIKLFKRHHDETPMSFVWNLRTDEGVKLLQHSGLTISEIADRVGFQSPYHFSKRVRARYGFSPRALRQRIWDTP